jgi:hypothetical protein
MSANGSGLLIIERILRDRQGIWQQIVDDRDLNQLTRQMLVGSVVALALYGAVLGSFHGALMALTSAVKLPLLFLVTLAICLPTLYLFNLVFGARLSVRQSVSLVMVAITVTAMLAVAFAPISLFFRITAPDYGFFKLLNIAILALSAIVGLRFLTGGMQVLHAHGLLSPSTPPAVTPAPAPVVPAPAVPVDATPAVQPVPVAVGAPNGDAPAVAPATAPAVAPPGMVPAYSNTVGGQPVLAPLPVQRPGARVAAQPRPASMTLLYIWILLFGFVGTQLAWTLRPFFGNPNSPFALFREIEGNFYTEVIKTIAGL